MKLSTATLTISLLISPALADVPGVIPTDAAQKLVNHDALFLTQGTQWYWIKSRVRPIDPGSQGFTWVWEYYSERKANGTEDISMVELAIDCHANPITFKEGYQTFGNNLNDFNMNMRKIEGTFMHPCGAGPVDQKCILSQLACEPTRFGAR